MMKEQKKEKFFLTADMKMQTTVQNSSWEILHRIIYSENKRNLSSNLLDLYKNKYKLLIEYIKGFVNTLVREIR